MRDHHLWHGPAAISRPAARDLRGFRPPQAYTWPMKHNLLSSRPLLSAAAGCLIAGSTLVYAADRMVPGRWEFTMITDGAPRVFASCMTAADAAQVNGDSASGKAAAEKKAEGRCAVKSYAIAGSTVEYTLVCGERTIRSRTVFHGDHSEGTLTTTVDGKPVTAEVKAHRLGAC